MWILRLKKRPFLASTLAALALTGCTSERGAGFLPRVYRIDVAQGNVLTQEMVNQLQPGMEEKQVRYILGSPTITDAFHPDRREYLYRLQQGDGTLTMHRITVYYENGRLVKTEGDLHPNPEIPTTAQRKETMIVVPPGSRPADTLFDWAREAAAPTATRP